MSITCRVCERFFFLEGKPLIIMRAYVRKLTARLLHTPTPSNLPTSSLVVDDQVHRIVCTWRSAYRCDDFVPDTNAKCKQMLEHMPHFIGRGATPPALNLTEPVLNTHQSSALEDILKTEKRQLLLAFLRPASDTYECTITHYTCNDEVYNTLFTFLVKTLIESKRIGVLVLKLQGLPHDLTTTEKELLCTAKKCNVPFEVRLYPPPDVLDMYRLQELPCEYGHESSALSRLKMHSVMNEIAQVVNDCVNSVPMPVVSSDALVWSWK